MQSMRQKVFDVEMKMKVKDIIFKQSCHFQSLDGYLGLECQPVRFVHVGRTDLVLELELFLHLQQKYINA